MTTPSDNAGVAAEYNASIEFGLDEGPEHFYNREPAAISSILSSA